MKQKMFLLMGLLFLLPSSALAHSSGGDLNGFMHGFLHPLNGLDHILAMVAVGLWASQSGGEKTWMLPLTFVVTMILGGVLSFTSLTIPSVESGILVSILILGVLTTLSFKLPLLYSSALVCFFALFHGYAHGAEMPFSMSVVSYIAGFSLVTAILHLSGIALGLFFSKASRLIGATITLAGLYLAVA